MSGRGAGACPDRRGLLEGGGGRRRLRQRADDPTSAYALDGGTTAYSRRAVDLVQGAMVIDNTGAAEAGFQARYFAGPLSAQDEADCAPRASPAAGRRLRRSERL